MHLGCFFFLLITTSANYPQAPLCLISIFLIYIDFLLKKTQKLCNVTYTPWRIHIKLGKSASLRFIHVTDPHNGQQLTLKLIVKVPCDVIGFENAEALIYRELLKKKKCFSSSSFRFWRMDVFCNYCLLGFFKSMWKWLQWRQISKHDLIK